MIKWSIALVFMVFAEAALAEPATQDPENHEIDHIALTSYDDAASTSALLNQMAADGNDMTGTFGAFSFASAMNEPQMDAVRSIAPLQFETMVGLPYTSPDN